MESISASLPSFLCIGNVGSGKSTLLNGILNEPIFKTKTTTLQVAKDSYGRRCIDTPGLAHTDINVKAAQEIDLAFLMEGSFTLLFVITLEAGNVRPDDIATMRLVLEATHLKTDEFSVIVNKISPPILKCIDTDEGFRNLLHMIINSTLPEKTNFIHYFPHIKELANAKDQKLPLTDALYQFLESCPSAAIIKPDKIDTTQWRTKLQEATNQIKELELIAQKKNEEQLKLMKKAEQEAIFNELRDSMASCTRCRSSTKYQLRYTVYSYNRFICNVCGVNKSCVEDGVLHCQGCDYDICASCSKTLLSQQKNKKSEYESVFQKLQESMTNCTRCKSTEKYLYTHTVYSHNRFICNVCGARKSSVDEGVLHCKGCDYDICASCAVKAVNKKNDANELVFKKLRDEMVNCTRCKSTEKYLYTHTVYAHNRFICNVCGARKSSVDEGVLHCKGCDYDICLSCAKKKLEAPKEEPNQTIFQKLRDVMSNCSRCKSTEKYIHTYTIYSYNRFICNVCGVTKGSANDGVLHCKGCDYDICISCARATLKNVYKL